jgi:hypothetical protein
MSWVYQLEQRVGGNRVAVDLEVVRGLVEYLKTQAFKYDAGHMPNGAGKVQEFTKSAIDRLEMGSRSEHERNVIIATCLEHVLKSALSPMFSALSAEEMRDPQKIFGASSAMDVIDDSVDPFSAIDAAAPMAATQSEHDAPTRAIQVPKPSSQR